MPQTVAAGGWWSYVQVNRSHVAPGQRVALHVTVAFSSTAAAEAAEQADRFRVYVLRDFDDSVVERAMRKPSPGRWWSLGGAEAIEVGQVTVSASGTNLAKATAAFTVPELVPGTYHLMLCDTGCTEPLPDVIPFEGFTVVADPLTAQTVNRVDRLERRSRNLVGQLAPARAEADEALAAARNAASEVERLQARVSSLARVGRSEPPAAPWAYAGWLLAAALAGALAVLVLRRRPRRVVRGRFARLRAPTTSTLISPRRVAARAMSLTPAASAARVASTAAGAAPTDSAPAPPATASASSPACPDAAPGSRSARASATAA